MLLSFIIPHYNLPRELLQRCICSIVAQKLSPSDYEIIIVDDGSEEAPRWVTDSFPGIHMKLIEAEHGGPGAARNSGLDEAQGEYIQFVDADDSIVPEAFDRCTEILTAEQPDILQHRYRICTTQEQMQQKADCTNKPQTYGSGAEYVACNNLSGSPCTYIFKRETAERFNIRFAEKVMHEDEDFNIRIYHYGKKLIVCDYAAYNYWQRSNSITTSKDKRHEEKRIKDLIAMLERTVTFRTSVQEGCTPTELGALNRKMAMLTVDTLLNLLYDGKSSKGIEDCCRQTLATLGLYPLPTAHYSLKYTIFRTLANSSMGIRILRMITPSQKPQKR